MPEITINEEKVDELDEAQREEFVKSDPSGTFRYNQATRRVRRGAGAGAAGGRAPGAAAAGGVHARVQAGARVRCVRHARAACCLGMRCMRVCTRCVERLIDANLLAKRV